MVSVILPAYNAEGTIGEAIKSIIDQTYKDWELLVINDGSTDNTKSVILSFNDPRIKYYENEGNKRLIYTLNRGLELARGKYIARMDSDDVSLPDRFATQVKYMDENPNVIVCGSRIQKFKGKKIIGKAEGVIGGANIVKEFLVRGSCFSHPTVFIRREVLERQSLRYNKDYIHAEDYKLWVDLAKYGDFYNLSDVLLLYRISENQISAKYETTQKQNARRCRKEYIFSFIKDETIVNDIKNNRISIHTIKKTRNLPLKSSFLIETMYLSFSKYGFIELLYLFISLDILRMNFFTFLAIIKRFLRGKDPLI